MVQDAGSILGKGSAPLQGFIKLNKLDPEYWMTTAFWQDWPLNLRNGRKNCRVNVNGPPLGIGAELSWHNGGTVSTEGHAYLRSLVKELKKEQIRDMFVEAKVGQFVIPGRDKSFDANHWTDVFMEKLERDIINGDLCGKSLDDR